MLFRKLLLWFCVFGLTGNIWAGDYEYELRWPDPQSHLYQVKVSADPSPGTHTDFQMPIWRPGRYKVQDYAAGVSAFQALDEQGNILPSYSLDKCTWRVENPANGRVSVSYQFYANVMDAGSSQLTARSAYINPVNFFMHVRDRYAEACTLRLPDLKPSWKAATALQQVDRQTYHATDYHELVDSPTLFSPDLLSLEQEIDGVQFHYHFQGNFNGGVETQQAYMEGMEKLVREQKAIFDALPVEEFHFIYILVPFRMRHAVEHRNSACFVLPEGVFGSVRGLSSQWGITSHEFFHLWNVKRLRPAALWPYDYQKEAYTHLHWFTEGVTDYYSQLALVRAGLIDRETFYKRMGDNVGNLENSQGAHLISPAEASFTSWVAGSEYADPHRRSSYYPLGNRLGMLLDLRIRKETQGKKGLDEVMRKLYEAYYLNGMGLPEDGVQDMAESVAGVALDDFFIAHVHDVERIDYAFFLAPFGLDLLKEKKEAVGWKFVGLDRVEKTTQGLYLHSVARGSDAASSGLGDGDMILTINGREVDDFDEEEFFSEWTGNKQLRLSVWQGSSPVEISLRWSGKHGPSTYKIVETGKIKAKQQSLLDGWLNSKR